MSLFGPANFILTQAELANLDFWANLMMSGLFALFAYPILQFVIVFCYRGGWRELALLPIVITGPVISYTALQIWRGADLWFDVAIYVLPPATFYLVVIATIHWFMRRQKHAP